MSQKMTISLESNSVQNRKPLALPKSPLKKNGDRSDASAHPNDISGTTSYTANKPSKSEQKTDEDGQADEFFNNELHNSLTPVQGSN